MTFALFSSLISSTPFPSLNHALRGKMDALLPKKSPRDPKLIGPWKVGRIIGRGCSGYVRIARHTKTGTFAAIKIISKSHISSRVSLNRMAEEVSRERLAVEREIVIMKLINHPNILHLYDVYETSTHLYLVLEYVQGGELFEHLCKKGPLPPVEAMKYFQQIIDAVDYFHRFNIAHRDLKPENILLDQSGNIKIADFGMAALQIDARGDVNLMKTSCGSPHYAAPEIVKGGPYVGSSADIWSCGVILYVLLTAQLPFDDDSVPDLLDKVTSGKFDIPCYVDSKAQHLIRRMLTVNVKRRITIPGILEHPFFQAYKSAENKTVSCPIPKLSQIAHPLESKASIDPEIFNNIRTLWHGASDEELFESLLNEDKNWQKGVYHLLVNYRALRVAEDPADDDEIELRRPRKEKKITEKTGTDIIEHLSSAFENGAAATPPSPPPPQAHLRIRRITALKPRGKKHNRVTSTVSSISDIPVIDIKPLRPALAEKTNVAETSGQAEKNVDAPMNTVLKHTLPSIPVSDLHISNIQGFFEQLIIHLTSLQEKMGSTPLPDDRARHEYLLRLAQEIQEHYLSTRAGTEGLKIENRVGKPERESMPLPQLVFHLGPETPPPSTSASQTTGYSSISLIQSHKTKHQSMMPPRPNACRDKENGLLVAEIEDCFKAWSNSVSLRRKLSLPTKYETERGRGFGDAISGLASHQQDQPRRYHHEQEAQLHHFRVRSQSGPSTIPSVSSPKSSKRIRWLDVVLRFKSSTKCTTLDSAADPMTTRNECKRLLENMGVHVQVFYHHNSQDFEVIGLTETPAAAKRLSSSMIVTMKCKTSDSSWNEVAGGMQATQFRVEVKNIVAKTGAMCHRVGLPCSPRSIETIWEEDGDLGDEERPSIKTTVTLTHEKGSEDTFKEIVKRLKNQWILAGECEVDT